MARYTAGLKKGRGDYYVVEFRHPVVMDRSGKQGRKMRRGLGNNDKEAILIVDDLNKLLEEEKYWYISEMKNALNIFHKKAVEIFYSQMEETIVNDSWNLREQHISLPDREEGYCKILFQGATGSGKTTVIRQLIGTNPDEISFPAISSSRTTICDTEFIFSDESKAQAIVTFITQPQAIRLIEECIIEGFKRAIFDEDEKNIAKAFLNHPEQRFRLSYFFGQYKSIIKNIAADDLETPFPDQQKLFNELSYVIKKIKLLVNEAKESFPPEDENVDEVIDLLYEDYLREESEEFEDLVDYILGVIKNRFSIVNYGTYTFDTRGWPQYWVIETEDKEQLIKQMRWFAGNDGRRFGQLLAPVVNGIRIKANFKPNWIVEKYPKLVIIDGEGVGHDSNIVTSLPISISRRFQEVDIIALVDNSVQPMLNIPKVIISDVTNRGYQNKLAVFYTRFEEVQGASLIDDDDRREHVLAIQSGAIESFESQGMNVKVIRQLREHLSKATYFLPKANELKKPEQDMVDSLNAFIKKCNKIIIEKEEKLPLYPEYDYGRLFLVIEVSSELYMRKWLGLLGIENSEFQKRHWSQIKALSNRLASWPNVLNYRDLEPVSDAAGYLIKLLNTFLNTPKKWYGKKNPNNEQKQAVINKITNTVSNRINDLFVENMKVNEHNSWIEAFCFRGTGSAAKRGTKIREIYDRCLPVPKVTYDETSDKLLDEIKNIIEIALSEFKKQEGL